MSRVDLALLKEGRPVAIVEAKGRAVPRAFHKPVLEQLRLYADRTKAEWVVFTDPVSTRIYRRDRMGTAMAKIPTRQIIESAGLSGVEKAGERILLLALDRWLRSLSESGAWVTRYHKLAGLAEAMSDVDESAWDYSVG